MAMLGDAYIRAWFRLRKVTLTTHYHNALNDPTPLKHNQLALKHKVAIFIQYYAKKVSYKNSHFAGQHSLSNYAVLAPLFSRKLT